MLVVLFRPHVLYLLDYEKQKKKIKFEMANFHNITPEIFLRKNWKNENDIGDFTQVLQSRCKIMVFGNFIPSPTSVFGLKFCKRTNIKVSPYYLHRLYSCVHDVFCHIHVAQSYMPTGTKSSVLSGYEKPIRSFSSILHNQVYKSHFTGRTWQRNQTLVDQDFFFDFQDAQKCFIVQFDKMSFKCLS
jgi:hypothetical protein